MAWAILFVAGLFEICWAVGLKYSQSFTVLWPSVFTLMTMVLSVDFLGWAMKTIPLGTAYAVWTGIGVLGTVVCGVLLFQESMDIMRMLFALMVMVGIVGLKFVSSH